MQKIVRQEVPITRETSLILNTIKEIAKSVFALEFLSGDSTSKPIFYDSEHLRTFEQDPSKTKRWLVKPTRIIVQINPQNRLVCLENIQGGVTPKHFEQFMTKILENDYPAREVDLTPIIADSFLSIIDSFTRIRMASVEITRPNLSWTDNENQIHELLDESDAERATIQVNAARGESLSKENGLVSAIEDNATSQNPNIKNAKLIGEANGTAEQTVSMRKFTLKDLISYDSALSMREQTEEVFRQMIDKILHRNPIGNGKK
ncbi:hypothetical protein [Arcanobacterium phocae]|uniref:hypothetical protein n=1 Tax=Arcanobacterium phocae TaxID=131112 RepID=UPI001C0EF456|nr:hypothetical protein [Arcanobacterium phocae]